MGCHLLAIVMTSHYQRGITAIGVTEHLGFLMQNLLVAVQSVLKRHQKGNEKSKSNSNVVLFRNR